MLSVVAPLFLAGALKIFSSTVRTPWDVVRQRMQVMGSLTKFNKDAVKQLNTTSTASEVKAAANTATKGLYRNTFHAATSIIRQEGFKSLFAGVGVTILRDIPFSVTYFLSYEGFRHAQQVLLNGSEKNDKLSKYNVYVLCSDSIISSLMILLMLIYLW